MSEYHIISSCCEIPDLLTCYNPAIRKIMKAVFKQFVLLWSLNSDRQTRNIIGEVPCGSDFQFCKSL